MICWTDQLSDDIYLLIFSYLESHDSIQFSSSKALYSQTILKKIRKINISSNQTLKYDLTNPLIRSQLFSLIEDPYQQFHYRLIHFFGFMTRKKVEAFSLDSIRTIHYLSDYLKHYMNHMREAFDRIYSLEIMIQCDTDSIEDVTEFFEYLISRNCENNDDSSTPAGLGLRELTIDFAGSRGLTRKLNWSIALVIPNLQVLCLTQFPMNVIPCQYAQLHKLQLMNCENIEDVSALGQIYHLILYHCCSVKDISKLQRNHTIEISSCDGIEDYSQSFEKSVIIKVRKQQNEMNGKNSRFSSHLKCVQSFTLHGFSSVMLPLELPSTIRYFKVQHVIDNNQIFAGFQHLRNFCLVDCPHVTSVELYGCIPILELRELNNLRSLKGLGKGNRTVIVQSCHEIDDFSPLKYLPTAEILQCAGFKNLLDVNHVKNLTILLSDHPNAVSFQDFSVLGEQQEMEYFFLEIRGRKIPSPIIGLQNIPIIEMRLVPAFLEVVDLDLLKRLFQGNHQKIIYHCQDDYGSTASSPLSSNQSGHCERYYQCYSTSEKAMIYLNKMRK